MTAYPLIYSRVACLLLIALVSQSAVLAWEFPSSITLRAGVLHAPPFATVDILEDGSIEYGGFQVDLLQRMKIFAARDNVDLQVELKPSLPQYGGL